MDAGLMLLAVAVIGVVGGRLLYELNPSLWENAAARVEDDAPLDGASLQTSGIAKRSGF